MSTHSAPWIWHSGQIAHSFEEWLLQATEPWNTSQATNALAERHLERWLQYIHDWRSFELVRDIRHELIAGLSHPEKARWFMQDILRRREPMMVDEPAMMATSETADLEHRMARCEAMLTLMLVTGEGGLDRDDYYTLRDLFLDTRRGSPGEEFPYHLDRLFRNRVERGEIVRDLRHRVGICEEKFLESRSQVAQLLERVENYQAEAQHFQKTIQQVEGFSKVVPRLEKDLPLRIDNLTSQQRVLQIDVHCFLAAQSLGLDLNNVPLPRFLPIRVYLSEASAKAIDRVANAVERLSNAFGFTVSDEFPEQKGSWWKKWFVKTKDVVTQPQVQQRLEKLERALELKGLGQPQADIDKTEAEAVATLVKALAEIPNAAVQAGSLLLVKVTNQNGQNCLQVRTLTQIEMIHLEKNQDLLTSPATVLNKLSELSRNEMKSLTDGRANAQQSVAGESSGNT